LHGNHGTLKEAEENGEEVETWFCHAEPGEYGDAVHQGEGDEDVESRG